jgi:mono/diheme cytochrome c family protein
VKLGSWVAAAVVLILLLVGAAAIRTRSNGMSTRTEPMGVERITARFVRRMAAPPSARAIANPVPFSDAVWAQARAHFADHCASCHANDGSGQTELGRNLYPRAPDMRLSDTQQLSDGELYWIIENGVRLTGMPAWGTGGDNDLDTWKLVHFIRRLKDLKPEHVDEMKALNPKTPGDRAEEQDDANFLAGQDVPPVDEHAQHHH